MKKFFTDNIAVVAILTFVLAGAALFLAHKNAKAIKAIAPCSCAPTETEGGTI